MKKNIYFIVAILMGMLCLSGCTGNNSVIMSAYDDGTGDVKYTDTGSTDTDGKVHTDAGSRDANGGKYKAVGNYGADTEHSETDADSGSGTDVGSPASESRGAEDDKLLYVYVCGHVIKPGVYALNEGDRICNALECAGGVSEDGAPETLAQAQPVYDGQTIYVPGIDEAADYKDTADNDMADDGLVNINSADKNELMTLPGIGESKALDIIRYREEHGSFSCLEDLMQITGIKEGVFNKIKDRIKV